MLAMTRLPSDSFLPSGGIDSFDRSSARSPAASDPRLNDRPPSVMSPLSLPHPIQLPYSDASNNAKSSSTNHAAIPSVPVPSNPQLYLSPGGHSSPTPMAHTVASSLTSPSVVPSNPDTMSPFEHLSPQTAAVLIQRRDDYSRRLRENWQAERTHLEASRARAEDMFREERQMMDDERLIWAEQKVKLENEIMDWKQRTQAAETEVTKLAKLLERKHNGGRKLLDRSFNGAAHDVVGSRSLSSSVSPGTCGASTTTFLTPSDGISPNSLPRGRVSTVPESNPFVPLDPRMQSASPDGIATRKEQERVPSIDINEVIPGLEGVRLRAPAVQKSTFNDDLTPSPIFAMDNEQPSNSTKPSVEQSKTSPAAKTQEALLAPEHRRLIMHAGHTPNHSMSFSDLPALDSSTEDVDGSNGTSTPTSLNEPKIFQADEEGSQARSAANQQDLATQHNIAMLEEAVYIPSDGDQPLKGPLCLKNRPASDEVFLRRLSDKLQEVKATHEPPSVLNEAMIPGSTLDLKGGSCANEDPDDGYSEDALEDIEKEIPLKLKKSNNFGLPLGQMRRASGI